MDEEQTEVVEKAKASEKESFTGTKGLKATKSNLPSNSKLLAPIGSARKKAGSSSVSAANQVVSTGRSSTVSTGRRNSTGSVVDKLQVSEAKMHPVKKDLPVVRKSLPAVGSSLSGKSGTINGVGAKRPQTNLGSPSEKLSSSVSSSSSSAERTAANRRTIPSPVTRSPSFSSGVRSGSQEKPSTLPVRKKIGTPDARNSRFSILPQVDTKGGDDVRLDLRGHKVRSFTANGLNLSPILEFVYLRDNLLSTVEGVEILTRVKVLDLSFNEFKGPGFEPLESCKNLQQLYLAGNQIVSLQSLPVLPNLEFLSVAQNKLKSLAMVSQPRLQVLAASKNKIKTLKGFPYLPVLEHLRIEENPILKMSHLEAACILLVGPSLKKFNDKDLPREEVAISKRFPACTALCIRDGWEIGRPDNATDSTLLYLRERWKENLPLGYAVKDAAVDKPSEEDVCRCHFTFSREDSSAGDEDLVLRYQWLIADRPLAEFSAIPNANEEFYIPKHDNIDKFLKVECTPVLGGTAYPAIFAISSRISRGSGIPKVIKLEVSGNLVEGSVLRGSAHIAWCGGTPGKGFTSWLRRRWNSSPAAIPGADNEDYQLTLDDVGSSLVFMYTPVTEEGARGEAGYTHTDFVKAGTPSVRNVTILGDAVEGNVIKGAGDYFGGKEGPSKFQWLRENARTGKLDPVSVGTIEYTLAREDVGQRMVFVYKPVNLEGQEGEAVSVPSSKVKQAPPKVSNVKIFGDLRENGKVSVSGDVTGGSEAFSKVQWFKTYSSVLDGENGLEPLTTAKTAKALRVPLGAVGHYLVAKFTPLSSVGESGESVYAVSERTVETLPPTLNFLSLTGDYIEGETLTASYGYLGGHEGKSSYKWYLQEVESEFGKLIPESSGALQYRLGKEAVGKYVSFQCVPVRDDGVVGEPRVCVSQERIRPGSPRLLALKVVGEATEGTALVVHKTYWGGEEGKSKFQWFRTNADGVQAQIPDATSPSYELSVEDISCFVFVSCQPVRSDWCCGSTVMSKQIGPIVPGNPTCKSLEFLGSLVEGQRLSFLASYSGGERGACLNEWFRVDEHGGRLKLTTEEFIDLNLIDVGHRIELTFTPVRHDGVKGTSKTIVSDEILPADPVGLELCIPECWEDEEVVLKKRYFGGEEGPGEYLWYGSRVELDGPEFMDLSNNGDDVVLRGKNMCFSPSLEDVGFRLILSWVPTRSDGKRGKPLVAISSSPVQPALPVVSDVFVEEISSSAFHGGGKYFGGHEGSSIYKWHRQTAEGSREIIAGADSRTYDVSHSDYNCRVLFSYTPVRSDSVVGEEKFSAPSDVILPEVPKIEMLALSGKVVEGHTVTAVELIPKSDIQQLVWNKFKKSIAYQWFISSSSGNDDTFEAIHEQHSCSYKVRLEDIGRCLRCECVVTDVFGRESDPSYAVTSPVLPGFPKIEKLEIEGRGFHTNLHAVRGVYSGGKEGKSRIQWLRSMIGSPDLISIPGEVGRMYEANVDDVGYRLVAVYTPVREDGLEGQPVSVSTEPIAVESEVQKEVKEKMEAGAVKFEALCYKDNSTKKVNGEGTLERRILEVNRKRIKVVKPGSKTSFPTTEYRGSYAPPFHVELIRSDQHRLRIVVDSENEVDLTVRSRHLRDVIVLVVRGFAQKFNSTSLNSLLKIES